MEDEGTKIRKFEGATTALITPMEDNGKVDEFSLGKLIEFNTASGIHNLVVNGTTAQSPTLSVHEAEKLLTSTLYSMTIHKNKVPVIFGAGSNDMKKSAKLTQMAAQNGADATLHVTGYYNMPPQIGMLRHFSACAAASEFPLIMYDVPVRGHPVIKPETRIEAALLNPGKIIGVKDATGGKYVEYNEEKGCDEEKNMWEETVRQAREGGLDRHQFKLISGDDSKTYEIMSKYEGVGVISVTSNIFPGAVSQMVELLLAGENAEAKSIDDALAPFNNVLKVKRISYLYPSGRRVKDDAFANPAPVQFAAYALGMIGSDRLELPLVGLSEDIIPMKERVVPSEARIQVLDTLESMYYSNPELFKPIEEFYNVDVKARLTLFREPARE